MYGLPYYERGIRLMYSEVTPYNKKIKENYKRAGSIILKFEDEDIRKITESLASAAKLKAKGKVKLFRKNVYILLDEYSVVDISKATGIPYYKVDKMLTWKRKNAISIMYKWKLQQIVKEEVADFFHSSLISYELPDMRYCKKRCHHNRPYTGLSMLLSHLSEFQVNSSEHDMVWL